MSIDTQQTLSQMETKKLKRLYNAHRSIQALCVLWILGSFFLLVGLILGVATLRESEPESIVGIIIMTPILGLYIATIIGCYKRANWGRLLGIVACVIALLGFPLGTIIGALGLYAFIGSPELFGPNRLDPVAVSEEYKYRKKNKIS